MKYRRLTGYKYQLAEEFSIKLPLFGDVSVLHPEITLAGGVLTIKAGYLWDGASGPTLDDATNMTPSLVHDALYELIRAGLLPSARQGDADYTLNQLSRDRGMPAWRRLLWFNGLSLLGFNAAKPKKVEPQDIVIDVP